MKIWLGAHAWGWQLVGVSFKNKWFFGFSRKATPLAEVNNTKAEIRSWPY